VIQEFLIIFIPIFVVIDPFASLPLFLTLTAGMDEKNRRAVAKTANLVAFIFLVVFALVGKFILDYLGISIDALMIAGGLLMLMSGFGMMREGDKPRSKKNGDTEKVLSDGNIAVVPLGTPMLAGPGALSLAIVMTQSNPVSMWSMIILSIAVTLFITTIIFFQASRIYSFIGETGSRALTRVMGLLVAAFAVQYILNGFMGWLQYIGII
jgi:multiple antibiotic resistance protein